MEKEGSSNDTHRKLTEHPKKIIIITTWCYVLLLYDI